MPGIGQKMTERLILELKNKFKNELSIQEAKNEDGILCKDTEINKMIDDLQLTLQSLNYKNKEINTILPILIKEVDLLSKKEKNLSFENLLILAMNHLDQESGKLAR